MNRRAANSADDRFEILLNRFVFAFVAKVEGSLKKEKRQVLSELQKEIEKSGKIRLERWRSLMARGQSKSLLRLALSGEAPLVQILKTAVMIFENQEDILRRFVSELGVAIKRKSRRPVLDYTDRVIVMLWDGFDAISRNKREAEIFRPLPPLSRWSGPAAWQCVKAAVRQPGLDYHTYRQRVRRLELHPESPVLVRKLTIGEGNFTVSYSPEGERWLRENRTATQTGKKMSHDLMTPMLFNAANGSGKLAKRARGIAA
jgi:hypothetical protein